MYKHPKMLSGVFCILALWLIAPEAATVTVNPSQRYQTFEGIGGFGAMHPWWTNGPFYTPGFIRLIIDTLGMTIIRTELYPRPDQTDMFMKQIPYLRAVKAHADSMGEPLKFIASIWTPPSSMKTNGSTAGGSLDMSKVGQFTDYLVNYIRFFRDTVKTDLYALSPQNEPQIGTPYNSCSYWPAELGDVIISLAPKIESAGLPTKIFFSDDICCWYDWNNQVQTRIQSNATANRIASIRAMHYAADNDAGSRSVYGEYGNGARATGKQAWNTEFGNGPDTWDGAWKNAKDMYHMLSLHFSAIVYWLIGPHTNPEQAEESVMYNLRRGPKAYALQAFARYLRPGAVRLGCTSSDANLWVLAFENSARGQTTVIILNTTNSTTTASVTGVSLPAGARFQVFQTSATQNCVPIGTAAVGESVSLTPRSITTLFYESQTTVRQADKHPGAQVSRRGSIGAVHAWYLLDGRRADTPTVQPAVQKGAVRCGTTAHGRIALQVVVAK